MRAFYQAPVPHIPPAPHPPCRHLYPSDHHILMEVQSKERKAEAVRVKAMNAKEGAAGESIQVG